MKIRREVGLLEMPFFTHEFQYFTNNYHFNELNTCLEILSRKQARINKKKFR
jgi:hypothetical protein